MESSANDFGKIQWQRIIVDEGHSLGRANSSMMHTISQTLFSTCKWICSGTPIVSEGSNTLGQDLLTLQNLVGFLESNGSTESNIFTQSKARWWKDNITRPLLSQAQKLKSKQNIALSVVDAMMDSDDNSSNFFTTTTTAKDSRDKNSNKQDAAASIDYDRDDSRDSFDIFNQVSTIFNNRLIDNNESNQYPAQSVDLLAESSDVSFSSLLDEEDSQFKVSLSMSLSPVCRKALFYLFGIIVAIFLRHTTEDIESCIMLPECHVKSKWSQ